MGGYLLRITHKLLLLLWAPCDDRCRCSHYNYRYCRRRVFDVFALFTDQRGSTAREHFLGKRTPIAESHQFIITAAQASYSIDIHIILHI